MSNKSEKDMLVSDERLIGYVTCNGVALWKHSRMTPVEVRDLYEAELSRLRSELDEALGVAKSIVDIWDEHGVDENGWTEDQAGVTNELYKEGVIDKARAILAKHKPE